MRSDEIKGICIKSADDMLAYSELFGASESVVRVRSFKLSGRGHVLLQLDTPVADPSGIYLRVNGDVFEASCFEISFCDPRSRTLALRFVQGRTDVIFAGEPEVEVVVDLSFLVRKARDYYEEFGDLVRYPDETPSFLPSDYPFPQGSVPTEQQREAVRTILNSRLSYVWGAPGTGKTQLVLATCIMAYVRRGRRVAVIAPTNNSVEQVLRGLVSAIAGDPEYSRTIDLNRDIARIGTPTPGFIRDFPGMCEPRAAESVSKREEKDREVLENIIMERRMDRARPHIMDCLAHMSADDKKAAEAAAAKATEALGHSSVFYNVNACLSKLDEMGLEYCARRMYARDRPLKDIG